MEKTASLFCGREAGKTRPLLLVAVGGASSEETFICQHAGADRWAAASVGIAQAATPKKPIPISPRNGEVSEKLLLEAETTGFQDPEKGGWEPVGPSGKKHSARRRARLEANGCTLIAAGRVGKPNPVETAARLWKGSLQQVAVLSTGG